MVDRCVFYECCFFGWQDIVYLYYGRQYFWNCYIEGSVDFIFGNVQVLFEYCYIYCKFDGFIIVQFCKSFDEFIGYVFLWCVIMGIGIWLYMYFGWLW